jgi:PAS domain S-box-containing protein
VTHPCDVPGEYGVALRQAILTGADEAYARATELGQVAAAAGILATSVLPAHHEIVVEALAGIGQRLVMARAEACLHSFLTTFDRVHTELRANYQALVEYKQAIEQLPDVFLEGIPAVIYVAPWDGEPGEMLYVSPQAESVLGYAAPDWIAQPDLWLARLDPEDREQALAERLEARLQRAPFVSEYRLQHTDGRWLWIHDEARILFDEAGAPLFWQGVLLEITQRKQAEQAAAVIERVRLARELHDSVMQTLIAANMHVRTLRKIWQQNPPAVDNHIREIEELTRTAVAELRVLLFEMRPLELTRTGLPRLLEQLVAAMHSRSSTVITLTADPVPPLAPDVQIAVYRIAQESLNNMCKHAGARKSHVHLQVDGERLVLSVTDDGVGFDPEAVPGGHFGVRGMVERAAAIDARLNIHSEPGAGTSIELAWPGTR